MRRLVALALVAAVAAGCCSKNANDVLSDTASHLDRIKSGTLSFSLLVTPRGRSGKHPFGFRLNGPFAVRRPLPLAKMTYTQTANGKSSTVTLTSTGQAAYMTVDGRTTQLPPDKAAPLQAATSFGSAGSLELKGWIHDAEVSDGGEVGGADTDHVHGNLDVARAIEDLGILASQTGPLSAAERERLEDATRSATIDVWSGKKDKLLRRLRVDVDFGLDVPQALRRSLGSIVGARVQIELGVARPNRPVAVPAVP